MIKTAMQLKDKVRNLSGGNSQKAQTLIRTFMMERFLERVSVSRPKKNFVLKGGMLVYAHTGLTMRATIDIDTTVKALSLSEARSVVEEIMDIDLGDGVNFKISSASDIMEGHEYPGIRFMLEGTFEGIRQPVKIDISTGDVITPHEIEFEYKLMFEDRTIELLSYNLETLLAEKLETVVSRGLANTRMRDFYDIHILLSQYRSDLNYTTLEAAFSSVCRNRGSAKSQPQIYEIINDIEQDDGIRKEWDRYQKANSFYVGDLRMEDVVGSVKELFGRILT